MAFLCWKILEINNDNVPEISDVDDNFLTCLC